MARRKSPRSNSPTAAKADPTPKKSASRSQNSAKAARPPAKAEGPDDTTTRPLSELRKLIDRVDDKLVKLLNERAQLVVEVGRSKRADGTPIYAPHREAEVLNRALARNTGPLPDRTIEGVYKEIMSGSFALEQPLRIGYLGPPGSFSHMAAMRQFGKSVDYEDLHEIAGVFTEVRRGHVDYGLVPIENSTSGGIVETLDGLIGSGHELSIYAEVQLAVHMALLANCPPSAVRRVHGKPEALAQCRTWLATQYPNAEIIPAASSSRGAITAAEECKLAVSIGAEPGSAAVGPALAGELYGLKTLFARIEDNANNVTRFVVISRQKAEPTGDDKTSIMFKTEDRPGALVQVLNLFATAGVNLSHIDKRPSGRNNWEYTFFVDALAHRTDPALAGVIGQMAGPCKEVTVLGSYPRSTRIL